MEYDEWVKTECQPAYRPINGHEYRIMRVAFTASRRMARKEIIDLLENIQIGPDGRDDALARAIRIISSTIKEG